VTSTSKIIRRTWRRSQGEVNLIIHNGKIIPYIPRKFKSHVLTNIPPTTMETNNIPSATTTVESHNQLTNNHESTSTAQDNAAENNTHS